VSVKVFIVEDLDSMRQLLLDVFASDQRFEVSGSAATEAEAKLWLEEHQAGWDLAVVDLMLSQGSGFGVVSRARDEHPNGCIAVLSSYVTDVIERHCLNLGADVVFSKSSTTEFLAWLRRVAEADAAAGAPNT
jgi:DNA-binding NarL/FixJ family response regulator